jgi:hypothetical protein
MSVTVPSALVLLLPAACPARADLESYKKYDNPPDGPTPDDVGGM